MNEELEKLKDENGQVSFAAATYYDEEMSVEQKERWLTSVIDTSTHPEIRSEAAHYLKRLKQPLDSEFIRPAIETRQTF